MVMPITYMLWFIYWTITYMLSVLTFISKGIIMKAMIINIGDELLIGQVTNFNASWMAANLNNVGIDVFRINIVSDTEDEILNALKEAETVADIILITGGLGPTNDDITKKCLCSFFNTSLVFDEETYSDIETIFKIRKYPMTTLNRMQAEILKGGKAIRNTEGTAPGLWYERNNKIFVATPGVPFEMKPMMTNYIIPMLEERMKGHVIAHKTILTQGIGESFLAEKIAGWEGALLPYMRLAYLPSPGLVRLRITARGENKMELQKQIMIQVERLVKIIPEYIFGYDNDTLEKIILNVFLKSKKTLSTAESCTGGAIAQRITSVPGSSSYFKGSVIAYANQIKEQMLGVSTETLQTFGAVSEETVKEMAQNVRKILKTDYAIAVSGIAGPEGGSEHKPVGLVYIAIADDTKVFVQKFYFGENRLVTIEKAVITSLNMLRKICIN